MVKLLTYIIPVDDGAAPNPYHGLCTLAICKPAIRRTAQVGDWVVGFGSKQARSGNLVNRVVYAMRVDEVLTMREYDLQASRRWPEKLPLFRSSDVIARSGDCIYDFSASSTRPKLRESVHRRKNRKTDLSGENVLLSRNFHYFGRAAIEIPKNLQKLVRQGQGHNKFQDKSLVEAFEAWISKQPSGFCGEPYMKDSVGSGRNCSCRGSSAERDANCIR